MPRSAANPLRDTIVPIALLIGDTVVTFAAVALGYWLRYDSPLARFGIDVPNATFARYLRLLLVGVALLIAAFAQFGLYDTRLVLRRYQSLNAILKGTVFWLLAYLGFSLAAKFDPPISRLFVVMSFACVIVLLYAWRTLAYTALTRTRLVAGLRRRTVLLGSTEQAQELAREIQHDPSHPFALIGAVTLPGTAAPFGAAARDKDRPEVCELGAVTELDAILKRERIDLLILTRADLPAGQIQKLVETCERNYVEWKIVPGAFDIFLSGLRLQTIGRVPLLGVEELTIHRLFSRILKRALDVIGALIGLVLSAPVIAVLAALIKRESPGGPAFFSQTRIGTGHRIFTLWKLRSMTPDAGTTDRQQQSTARNDPRLLRIGAFMRRWNLDELPQFWNVLCGQMSLVGPRPERPYHVEQLSAEIPHYLPRHLVKPGMTGWAQVNGLRGGSDLTARVQHDIYYIENWSLWLDVQIILLTFVRWRSDSAY
jgi:exopolysaccharide biosynthesis polyprenyl glycosylphosphotransferase